MAGPIPSDALLTCINPLQSQALKKYSILLTLEILSPTNCTNAALVLVSIKLVKLFPISLYTIDMPLLFCCSINNTKLLILASAS